MLLRSLRKYSSFIVFLCSILSWSHRSHCQGHLLAVMRHSIFSERLRVSNKTFRFFLSWVATKERVILKRNTLFIFDLFCNKGLFRVSWRFVFLKIKLSHIIRNRQIRKDKESSWVKVKVKKWKVSQRFSAFNLDRINFWNIKNLLQTSNLVLRREEMSKQRPYFSSIFIDLRHIFPSKKLEFLLWQF